MFLLNAGAAGLRMWITNVPWLAAYGEDGMPMSTWMAGEEQPGQGGHLVRCPRASALEPVCGHARGARQR